MLFHSTTLKNCNQSGGQGAWTFIIEIIIFSDPNVKVTGSDNGTEAVKMEKPENPRYPLYLYRKILLSPV